MHIKARFQTLSEHTSSCVLQHRACLRVFRVQQTHEPASTLPSASHVYLDMRRCRDRSKEIPDFELKIHVRARIA